jgi:tetratricopeptide (TPR) repeat protein
VDVFTEAELSLWSMPFRGYFVTTSDTGLEDVARISSDDTPISGFAGGEPVFPASIGEQVDVAGRPIMYPHGTWRRPERLVVSPTDFKKLYGRKGQLAALLSSLLADRRLLFVGFDIHDPWLSLLRKIIRPGYSDLPHVAIIGLNNPSAEAGPAARVLRSQFGFEPVFYRRSRSGIQHELESLLENAVRSMNRDAPPARRPITTPPDPVGKHTELRHSAKQADMPMPEREARPDDVPYDPLLGTAPPPTRQQADEQLELTSPPLIDQAPADEQAATESANVEPEPELSFVEEDAALPVAAESLVSLPEPGAYTNDPMAALAALLEDVAVPQAVPDNAGECFAAPAPVESPQPTLGARQEWLALSSDDSHFIDRHVESAMIDEWLADPRVNVISITGDPGSGRTAILGQTLKHLQQAMLPGEGVVFYWSFAVDRRVDSFLRALVKFLSNSQDRPSEDEPERLVDMALALLAANRAVIGIDGLEVLQEWPGTREYSRLLEGDLRELLDRACREDLAGTIFYTNRHDFADLEPYDGHALRILRLSGLSVADGAQLLQDLGVVADQDVRGEIAGRLGGNPLGLRVFAAAMGTQTEWDASRLIDYVCGGAADRDSPFDEGVLRLLDFYSRHTPPERLMLLGGIALFRASLPTGTVAMLAQNLSLLETSVGNWPVERISQELDCLVRQGLLIRDQGDDRGGGFSCPVPVRPFFRDWIIAQDRDLALEVADLLAGDDVPGVPQDLRDIEAYLIAIAVLLDSGDFVRSDHLYRLALGSGQVFETLKTPYEGARTVFRFVATPRQRAGCEGQLGKLALSSYLYSAGHFLAGACEFPQAASCYADSLEIDRSIGDQMNRTQTLQNYSSLLTVLGRLEEACAAASQSVALATEMGVNADNEARFALCCLGHAMTLRGRADDAVESFAQAMDIHERLAGKGTELYGINGILWADLLIRIDRRARARELTEANLRCCVYANAEDDVALCYATLGRLAAIDGDLETADVRLARAEQTLRRDHRLQHLPALLVDRARVLRKRGMFDEATDVLDDALRIAQPRSMKIVCVDGAVEMSKLSIDLAKSGARGVSDRLMRAQTEAQGALTLAIECGYAWGQRDALSVLGRTWTMLGDHERAEAFLEPANRLSRFLAVE